MNEEASPVTRRDRFAVLVAFTALGVSWPVLELLSRNVEFFVVRRTPRWEIVGLALLLAFGVPLVVALAGSLRGRAGMMVGTILIVASSCSVAWLYLRRTPLHWLAAMVAAILVGLGALWAVRRWEGVRLLARFLSPAPLIMVLIFLFATPVGGLLSVSGARVGSRLQPSNNTPVLMIVFDELPGAALVDSSGDMRRDRYPNFARLADDGVWFPNAVTVSDATEFAVPAMLTGVDPDDSKAPYTSDHPENLFVALSDGRDLHVHETITQLCPQSLCESTASISTPLLTDVGILAGHALLPEPLTGSLPAIDGAWADFGAANAEFDSIAAFREAAGSDPTRPIGELIDDIAEPRSGQPPFYFLHVLMPHHPWEFLPDGHRYPLPVKKAPGRSGNGWGDDDFLLAQAAQRMLLQLEYTDTALGEIFGALDRAGTYDETAIVVVSDHGIAITENVAHQRRITDDTVGDIAAVALFVKAPSGPAGVIDDRRAHTTDIAPTVAEILGTTLPWETDGVSLLGPDPDRVESTTSGPKGSATYGVDGHERLEVAARLERWFPTGDPWPLRPPSSPDLLGDELDVTALETSPYSARLDQAELYRAIDLDDGVLPARVTGELVGTVDGTELLAIVVNGRVGALTRSFLEDDDDRVLFQAMVPVEYWVDGVNDVAIVEIGTDDVPRLVEKRR
ncbi:MAG: sulfatase-like hydrolase/transferase [Acidimicrobiia bacterium]|nr:sulfatase-like hydrolase/transferase [Acidimicrobiia bacterium]